MRSRLGWRRRGRRGLGRRRRHGTDLGRTGGGGGGPDGRRRRGSRLGDAIGLESAEGGEGAEPFAAGGFAAAEDFLEGVGILAVLEVGGADGVGFGLGLLGDEGGEDEGFEAVHAALGPIGGDEFFEEESLLGSDGLELLVVGGDDFEEIGLILAGDEEGMGRSSVLQRVERGGGLALGGAWASGFLSVQAIGVDLSGCSHNSTVEYGWGAGGGWAGKALIKKEIHLAKLANGFAGWGGGRRRRVRERGELRSPDGLTVRPQTDSLPHSAAASDARPRSTLTSPQARAA